MGNGYPVVQPDELASLKALIQSAFTKIRELERPTGTQLSSAVATLQALVEGLIDQTDINATGNATIGGNMLVSGQVKFPAVFSNPITTAFRVVYDGNGDGSLGFNLSSRRYKQDILQANLDPRLLAKLRIVTFRYIAAVEQLGDDAVTEVGLIAEEVDELGLTWLVDYDPDTGLPDGLKFDRLAVAALGLAENLNDRVAKIEAAIGLIADGDT